MAVTCFPDNTVLINFGYIDRLDLLERLLPARVWCLTVARECRQSYAILGFSTYPDVKALFGEPLIPTRAESINLTRLRDDIASPGDKPDAHIGEAETITLAKSRRFDGPILVTDDLGAATIAQQEGMRVLTTWTLIKAAVRHTQQLDEQQAWEAALVLRTNKRGWPRGIGHTRADFIAWLRQ